MAEVATSLDNDQATKVAEAVRTQVSAKGISRTAIEKIAKQVTGLFPDGKSIGQIVITAHLQRHPDKLSYYIPRDEVEVAAKATAKRKSGAPATENTKSSPKPERHTLEGDLTVTVERAGTSTVFKTKASKVVIEIDQTA